MSMQDFVKTLSDEQKKALLQALNDNSVTLQSVPKEVNEQTKKILNDSFIAETKPSVVNQKRKEPVRAKENTWQDTGEHKNIETPPTERTPRKRSGAKKLEMKCHVCGKPSIVDTRFVFGEYYRCNRCSSHR